MKPPNCGDRRTTPLRMLPMALLWLLVSGCATDASRAELEATRAELPPSVAGIDTDGRGRFRSVMCALAAVRGVRTESDRDCENHLWRLADEPKGDEAGRPLPELDPLLNVFVVGGAFSDCFGDASIAWRDAIAAMSAQGYKVRTIAISSRSGADRNARMIADAFKAAAPTNAERVLLVGYSKGSVDILHFLAGYPQLAALVDAVTSVAGPVLGSSVARSGAWAYDALLAHAFSGRCDPGDGGVIDSLLPERRQQWLAANPLPEHLRYYVLSAFTTREHMARALVPTWRRLAATEPRNDGQVTLGEALLPGATLLGYANADHWGVAIDIEKEMDFVAARPDPAPFPRALLFEAMLRYVNSDLDAAPAAQILPGSAIVRSADTRSP